MEREVGGGIGMGNTCKPMADSFQCMTKSTTIKKKKKKTEKHKFQRVHTTGQKVNVIGGYAMIHGSSLVD